MTDDLLDIHDINYSLNNDYNDNYDVYRDWYPGDND